MQGMQALGFPTTSFDSAVRAMVAIHNAEIYKLKTQIAACNGCADTAHRHDFWLAPNSEGDHYRPQSPRSGKVKPSTPKDPTTPVLHPSHESRRHKLLTPTLGQTCEQIGPCSAIQDSPSRDGGAEPSCGSNLRSVPMECVIGCKDENTCQPQCCRAEFIGECRAGREDLINCGRGRQLSVNGGHMEEELPSDDLSMEEMQFEPSVPRTNIRRYWERTQQHEFMYCTSSLRAAIHAESLLSRSKWSRLVAVLQAMPGIAIMMNAITIGVSADVAPEARIWIVFEAAFILVYALEFIAKLSGQGWREYFCGIDRRWNWFDFICLCVALTDLAIVYVISLKSSSSKFVGLMKVLRLARLARLVRALKLSIFSELKQMFFGVMAGVRVLVWAIVLLLVFIYFVGVSMRLAMSDEEGFTSLPTAMLTVFRCVTDGCVAYDGTPLAVRLFLNYGAVAFFGYVLIFMLLSVGVFNLIMAIFIDDFVRRNLKRQLQDIGASQESTKLKIKQTVATLMIQDDSWRSHLEQRASLDSGEEPFVRNTSPTFLARAFSHMKLDENAEIKRQTFQQWIETDKFHTMLKEAGIDTGSKEELFDVLDVDTGGSLSMDELVTGLMKMRGPITKSDIIAVQLKVRYITGILEDIWHKVMDVRRFWI